MTKSVTITQFLTDDEIARCVALYKRLANTGKFASTVAKDIIEPNIERINKALGQENDPRFLAYAVEYVMIQARHL